MRNDPIGIFDSGIGGTSVFKEIHNRLPHENFIYLADSKNAPYGNKSKDEIIHLGVKNTDYLLQNKCKIIVIACNTATTNAISHLRAAYNVPFIGAEPAIKPAALQTKTKAIGVLATKGTLSSQLFYKTADLYAKGILIVEQIGDGIVPLIESGDLYSSKMKQLLESYITPMLKKNIDYLVLGCTHYPYLTPLLQTMLPEHVKIIDSGLAMAKQTQNVLRAHALLNQDKDTGSTILYSNGDLAILNTLIDHKFNTAYLDF